MILDFLLTTLEDDRVCLSHLLLGLVPFIDNKIDRWDLKLAPNLSRTGLLSGGARTQLSRFPDTCLGQVLLMVEDSKQLVLSSPKLSSLCYELIYSLCKSKLTSHVTLSLLRHYTITVVTPPGSGAAAHGTGNDTEEEKEEKRGSKENREAATALASHHRFLAFCLKQVLSLSRLKDTELEIRRDRLYDSSAEGAYSYSNGSILRRNTQASLQGMDTLARGSMMGGLGSPLASHFSAPQPSNVSFGQTHTFGQGAWGGGSPAETSHSFGETGPGPRNLNFSPTGTARTLPGGAGGGHGNVSPENAPDAEGGEQSSDDAILRKSHCDEVRATVKCVISWLLRLFALEFRCMEELAKNHGILALDLQKYVMSLLVAITV